MSNRRPLAPAFPICRFSFADGRRCALPATPESNGLCYTHANAPHRRLRPSDLARELTSSGATAAPEKIARLLSELPRALAEGLLSRKEADAMSYLCSVMLQTALTARSETLSVAPDAEWDFVSRMLDDDDDAIANPPLDLFND